MKRFQKIFTSGFILIFLFTLNLSATHNRAGEITLKKISDLTYELTLTTFTYSPSPANATRNYLTVSWGDNTSSEARREEIVYLSDEYQKNVYITRHTYPGPGTYAIVVEDPNRNLGIVNIPNSVNVVFSVKTIIAISPEIGENNTPILLNYPIDKAALNYKFVHNPAAFDFEGDSLSYSLTICTRENGEEIENYEFPEASDTLYVDPITGDLVWDSPVDTGKYNIAMNIEEWRDGVKIGNIARDMQIDVYETLNSPPVNDSIPDLCVLAGTTVQLPIRSTDANNDNLTHLITGGPFAFEDSSVSVETISSVPGAINSLFTWNTSCEHVRNQAYTIIIKTTDDNAELNLVDIDNFNIKVLGPKPEAPELVPSSMSINLLWNMYQCSEISGYNIYRTTGSKVYNPDSCSPGLPGSSGYELIGTTSSISDTTFLDNNDNEGLLQGLDYCYRITAVFPDGSESFPSDENCSNLVSGSPSILQTSVINYDENGEILISWAKPRDLDTIPAIGPYEYIIYRSPDLWGNDLIAIDSFTTSNLDDTTYNDIGINTVQYPYSYSVEFYNDEPGNRFLIGKPEIASTMYPDILYGDNQLQLNFKRNVPWLIDTFIIYRYNTTSAGFDSIAFTTENSYTDKNLKNLQSYCYYLDAIGERRLNGITYKNNNISHQNCGIPMDDIAPCPPNFEVVSSCDSMFNLLSWNYTTTLSECSEDVIKYYIYYRSDLESDFLILDSLQGRENTSYRHYPENGLAAQYYITAIDSFLNESNLSVRIIVDNCIKYSIPNVFSPNNDGFNDILRPYEYQDIEKIDLNIYNRWGQLIFRTEDPDISWNGKHMNSNTLVSPGVYYYICDVYEKRITGTEVRNIVGFIHIYHEKDATNIDEVDF